MNDDVDYVTDQWDDCRAVPLGLRWRRAVVADPKYPPQDEPDPEEIPFEADEEQENKR